MAGLVGPVWSMFTALARHLELNVAPVGRGLSAGEAQHLVRKFREAERRGIMLASFVRTVIILGLMLVFAVTGQMDNAGYAYLVFSPLGIAVIGIAQYVLERTGRSPRWAKYAFVLADCLYLALMLGLRHQFSQDLPTATMTIKEGGILFFFAFLVHGAFTYSPRFVLWAGLCIAGGWLLLMWLAFQEPGTTIHFAQVRAAEGAGTWERYGAPVYLPVMKVVYDFVVLVFFTIGLSVAVARSRLLVLGAAEAEWSRANLARHFSPRMVDVASQLDRTAFAPLRQDAAILFADIRGFTAMAEAQPPEQTVALLKLYHARMQDELFAQNGTLDRIMGDGLLATFGIPGKPAEDATSAFQCATNMLAAISAINEQLADQGLPQIKIGIGLHFGQVMFGDIGSARMATFTVVGDTVNVASRLQTMTRTFGADIAMSARFLARLREEGVSDAVLAAVRSVGVQSIRGRQGDLEVFTLGEVT